MRVLFFWILFMKNLPKYMMFNELTCDFTFLFQNIFFVTVSFEKLYFLTDNRKIDTTWEKYFASLSWLFEKNKFCQNQTFCFFFLSTFASYTCITSDKVYATMKLHFSLVFVSPIPHTGTLIRNNLKIFYPFHIHISTNLKL